MGEDVAVLLTRIADAARREDGSDIPLGEQCRAAAAEIMRLRAEVERLAVVAEQYDRDALDMRYQRDAADNRAETAEARLSTLREKAAKVAERVRDEFLSPKYASNQPLGSFCERFACDEVAAAIRAMDTTT